jgi:YHS domain-containing protein
MSIKTKENPMKKNFSLLAIIAAVVVLLGLYAVARPAGDDMAKDPVCGMSVKIAGAAHTAEYLGKTYYFCSEDCKTAFLKEPAKFASKEATATPALEAGAPGAAMPDCSKMKDAPTPCCQKMEHGGMRMKGMHGMPMKPGMMGHGMAGGCPLCSGKAEIAVENTTDGAVVRISSKDPEAVKMIQEHLAAMKAACSQTKKAEEKKEK